MDAIARRAGASKATLYRRWPDRLELAAVLLDALAARRPTLPETGSVDEELAVLVHRWETELHGAAGALLLGLASEVRRRPELAEQLQAFVAGVQDHIRTVLERGQARGELDPALDVDLVAEMVTSQALARGATGVAPLTRREAERRTERLLRAAVRAPAVGGT
jgi:AcrR family transcriptional regulator